MNITSKPVKAADQHSGAPDSFGSPRARARPFDGISLMEKRRVTDLYRPQLSEEGRPILQIGESEPVPRASASFSVDNESFAAAVFHTLPADAITLGCVRRNSSHPSHSSHWVAGELTTVMNHRGEVYVPSSSYRLNENGHLDISKACFAGLHFFVLGDCGGRIKSERLFGMEFSWELETPSQELQVGIIFERPIEDAATALALLDAATRAGLCHESGMLPPSHWARLPGRSATPSLMEKPSDMYAWNPAVRWSLETFCRAFDLDLTSVRA